jgi:hypothetical protein
MRQAAKQTLALARLPGQKTATILANAGLLHQSGRNKANRENSSILTP